MKVRMAGLMVLGLAAIVLPQVARADWVPSPLDKWVQLPDFRYDPGSVPLGMDVNATDIAPPGMPPDGLPRVLADDFQCTQTGPITNVHIWGSWKHNLMPFGDPNNVAFRLSIHADLPAGVPDPEGITTTYSRPAQLLKDWTFTSGQFRVVPYGPESPEGWYDPARQQYEPVGDTQAWLYNFSIPETAAFVQRGTPEKPITYWLDVDVIVPQVTTGEQPEFGWKTSDRHWNDDATWRIDSMPPDMWNELRYPSAHPLYGQSIDMAFVITPEPATLCLLGAGLAGLVARRMRRK